MPRLVTVILLVVILLLLGVVFFQVMANFLVPLFLAAVLVVVFRPLHTRIRNKLPLYPKLAALATTTAVMLVALLPTVWLGWNSYVECSNVFNQYLNTPEQRAELQKNVLSRVQPALDFAMTISGRKPAAKAAADGSSEPGGQAPAESSSDNENRASDAADPSNNSAAPSGAKSQALLPVAFTDKVAGYVGTLLLNTVQTVGWLLLGLFIMIVALYYFFLDGPNMIAALMRMSPLDDAYERELLDKFASVSRAVVVASLSAAVAQGLLAGIGYYFAFNSGAPIFLLTMLTILLAIVPFIGGAAVWVPAALWIYLFQTVTVDGAPKTGDPFSAICLTIYCVIVVSTVDNLIKPWILHGQSNLHPLLALISVLGGMQALGPIGILVGPILVAFIQALLNMVNRELVQMGEGGSLVGPGTPAVSVALGPAEQMEVERATAGDGALVREVALAAVVTPQPTPSPPAEAGKSSKRRRRGK